MGEVELALGTVVYGTRDDFITAEGKD